MISARLVDSAGWGGPSALGSSEKNRPCLTFFQRGVVGTKRIWDVMVGWIQAFLRAVFCCQWGTKELAPKAEPAPLVVVEKVATKAEPRGDDDGKYAGFLEASLTPCSDQEDVYHVIEDGDGGSTAAVVGVVPTPPETVEGTKFFGSREERLKAPICALEGGLMLIQAITGGKPIKTPFFINQIMSTALKISPAIFQSMGIGPDTGIGGMVTVYNKQFKGCLQIEHAATGEIDLSGDENIEENVEVDPKYQPFLEHCRKIVCNARKVYKDRNEQFNGIVIRIQQQNVFFILAQKMGGGTRTYYFFNPHGCLRPNPELTIFKSPNPLVSHIAQQIKDLNWGATTLRRDDCRRYNSAGTVSYEAWVLSFGPDITDLDSGTLSQASVDSFDD